MFGKTKWYRTAFKAYRRKKIEEPYRTLLKYYMAVGYGTPIARFDGHRDFFALEEWDGSIKATTEDLRAILPKHLFENYLSALDAYNSLGEDHEYEVMMAAFEKQDFYVYEHGEEIEEILIDYVNVMKERKAF